MASALVAVVAHLAEECLYYCLLGLVAVRDLALADLASAVVLSVAGLADQWASADSEVGSDLVVAGLGSLAGPEVDHSRRAYHNPVEAGRNPYHHTLVLRLGCPGSHEARQDPESEVGLGTGSVEVVLADTHRNVAVVGQKEVGRGIADAAEVEVAAVAVVEEGLDARTVYRLVSFPSSSF